MTYITINGTDFSSYINSYEVSKTQNYNTQTTASGKTVYDLKTYKQYTISITSIPLKLDAAATLVGAAQGVCQVDFLDPSTNRIISMTGFVESFNASYYSLAGAGLLKEVSFDIVQVGGSE